jgi:predicted secreted Zn-dependent protease
MGNLTDMFFFAPGLIAVAFVVWVFLKHLQDERKAIAERDIVFAETLSKRDEHFSAALDKIEEKHHDACLRSIDAMKESTAIISQIGAHIERTGKVIDNMDNALARFDRRDKSGRKNASIS